MYLDKRDQTSVLLHLCEVPRNKNLDFQHHLEQICNFTTSIKSLESCHHKCDNTDEIWGGAGLERDVSEF